MMTTILACPVCDVELTMPATAATCPNTHTVDRARRGCLNLMFAPIDADVRRVVRHDGALATMIPDPDASTLRLVIYTCTPL